MHLLLVILAIEQLFIQEVRTTPRQFFVGLRFRGFANSLRHRGEGRQRPQVDAGAHSVRPPEFDVVGIVVRLKQGSLPARIPGANAVIQAPLGQRIHLLQPIRVSRNLPVAEHFHDAAQLPV